VSGQVLVDGKPLTSLQTAAFRLRLAFVPQEPVLFDDTVRENILFGQRRPLSDDDVWRFLERAHCTDFIRAIPDGLDARIGERGTGCRAASASGWRWRGRWPTSRIFSSWTNPPAPWTANPNKRSSVTLDELRGELTIILCRTPSRHGARRRPDRDSGPGKVTATGKHHEFAVTFGRLSRPVRHSDRQ